MTARNDTPLVPLLTPELTVRIEQSDIDYSRSRLEGMRHTPGNPLGIELRQYGMASAFLIKAWPDFWYGNKVLGLESASIEHLPAIHDFFHSRGLSFRFEIRPGKLTRQLGQRLHRLGFCQMSFNTALYGRPTLSREQTRSAVTVRAVAPTEYDLFLDVYQAGFELPPLQAEERRAARAWLEHAHTNLHLCFALIEGMRAGVGVLYANGRVGLLADAATLPEFRRRGCHQALLTHRITEAAGADCDLLTSFVEFGSASHRHLEQAGLRVAYTKSIWWAAG
jgi:GNAT superfamily N-acetyltransferase